jgi:GNAT superfamily N-acetyltransferase
VVRAYTEASRGHGFISEKVPELTIAVVASHRNQGIGRRLLHELLEASVAQGYPAISLSVAENNPARELYRSMGFEHVTKHGWTWTMVRRVDPNS